jgi:hypothetical protein
MNYANTRPAPAISSAQAMRRPAPTAGPFGMASGPVPGSHWPVPPQRSPSNQRALKWAVAVLGTLLSIVTSALIVVAIQFHDDQPQQPTKPNVSQSVTTSATPTPTTPANPQNPHGKPGQPHPGHSTTSEVPSSKRPVNSTPAGFAG